jgi:hypothetical protein
VVHGRWSMVSSLAPSLSSLVSLCLPFFITIYLSLSLRWYVQGGVGAPGPWGPPGIPLLNNYILYCLIVFLSLSLYIFINMSLSLLCVPWQGPPSRGNHGSVLPSGPSALLSWSPWYQSGSPSLLPPCLLLSLYYIKYICIIVSLLIYLYVLLY